nr:reverse transcriptase domain-containing protein [Tanacetum cinerariifolium]
MKMNTASSLGSRTLPGNTITNLKEDLKGITTRRGTAYLGHTIPTTTSSSSPVVERENEATKDMVYPANNESTKDVQPLIVPTESLILNSELVISPIIEPVASPVNQQVKAVTLNCETCGGPYSFSDCLATVGNTQNVYDAGAYQEPNRNQGNHNPHGNNQGRNQFFQRANQVPNQPPAYQAPAYQALVYQAPVHQPQIPQPQVVTTNEFTNFMKANDAILKNMQTNKTSLTNLNLELKNMFGQFMKMNTALSSGSITLPSNIITNPKEDLKGITTHSGTAYQGPTIPTTSSSLFLVVKRKTKPIASLVSAPRPKQRPSIPYPSRFFADALILMPKFDLSIKSLLTNKDKLCELARTLLNEYCSTVLLKKLLEKLGDPGKFLILCDFLGVAECLALADLSPSINIMPLSVWNKLSLPDFPHTCELTLRVGKKAISFNLDQTSRYLANYNDMSANRIDVIDMACEEYSQEVFGFFDVIASGNPTPYYDPIVSTTSSTLNPFENSDFLLEDVDAFLALEDDHTSPKVDQSYLDSEGDILLLEAFLNDDPSLPPPNQGNYLPQVRKELKICEAKTDKSSIDEPPEVELKDLPPHLEYAFLEGNDKLTVIIVKDLSVEEKTALITVLKSHKRDISWKLSDIKGIDPEFCTHKILMEEDFEPAIQHQRRVNPKIHDVIK